LTTPEILFLHFDLRAASRETCSIIILKSALLLTLFRSFADDGKYCLTAGYDRSVRLWNPARLDPAFPPLPSDAARLNAEIVPVDALPRVLPIQSYTDGLTHPISSIAVDDHSTLIASASDKTLVVHDVVTQQVKRRFQGHVGRINAVCISTGAETYLSASYDATVCIWDGRSRSYDPIQILREAKDSVTSIHVQQDDGTAIIRTAAVDGIIRTYDLRKGVIRCDDFGSSITSMAPTYDGQCLAVSCLDGAIRLMELDTGELLNTYHSQHTAGHYGLECCLTADDATIVTGSEDGSAIFYDLVRATRVQSLEGHTKPTCSIAAYPKREHTSVIITASYDGNAIVWGHDPDFIGWTS